MVEPVKKLALPVVAGVLLEMFEGSWVMAAPTFTTLRILQIRRIHYGGGGSAC